MNSKSTFGSTSPLQRIELARQKVALAAEAMGELIELNTQRKEFLASHIFRENRQEIGIRLLQQTTVLLEVVQICRIWDKPEEQGFSLPTLSQLLSGSEVRQTLEIMQRGDGVTVVPLVGAPADGALDFLSIFDEALARIDEIVSSEQLQRLIQFRHKALAHAVPTTRDERKMGTVFKPLPEDIEFAMENAIPALQVIETTLNVRPVDYMQWRIRSTEVLRDFYSRIRIETQGSHQGS